MTKQTQQRIYLQMINLRSELDRLLREFEATLPNQTEKKRESTVYNPKEGKVERVKFKP